MKILFATTAHIEDLGVLVYVCKSFHTRIGLSKVEILSGYYYVDDNDNVQRPKSKGMYSSKS